MILATVDLAPLNHLNLRDALLGLGVFACWEAFLFLGSFAIGLGWRAASGRNGQAQRREPISDRDVQRPVG